MSRAFVKDDDGGEGNEDLPDRLISEHRNLVTPEGLSLIEVELDRLGAEYALAQSGGDRIALQRLARDLRYWTSRRASAEVQPAAPRDGSVHFGSTVELERANGRNQVFRIVGEDEADPAKGTISYVSPLAQALFGRQTGDDVEAGALRATIIAIT